MTKANLDPERLWNRSYILILILNSTTFSGFMMVNPFLAKHASQLGASLTVAGLLAGIFAIMALVARPVAGLLVDRVARKRLLVVVTGLLAVATFGYVIAPTYQVLFIARIFHGAFFALSTTAGTSIGASLVPKKRLGEGLAYLGMGYTLANAIGPSLGGFIETRFGSYQAVFMASTLILVLTSLCMALLLKLPEQRKPSKDKGKPGIRPGDLIARELLLYSFLVMTFSILAGLVGNFMVMIGDERNISNITVFFTVNALTLLAVRPLTGRLIDRHKMTVILMPAFVLAILAAVVIGLAQSLIVICVGAAILAIGIGTGTPAIQTSCMRKLGPARLGVATSTYFIGMDVGQSLGAILGGGAADLLGGFEWVFYGAGAVLLIGMALFWLVEGRKGSRLTADEISPEV